MHKSIIAVLVAGALFALPGISSAQQPGMGMGMGMGPAAPLVPPEGTRVFRDIEYVTAGSPIRRSVSSPR